MGPLIDTRLVGRALDLNFSFGANKTTSSSYYTLSEPIEFPMLHCDQPQNCYCVGDNVDNSLFG